MKKLLLTIAAISALTLTTVAQNNRTTAGSNNTAQMSPEQKAEKETANAATQLGLNDTQKAKFKQLTLERVSANQPLRAKAKAATTKEEKKTIHTQIKANNEKYFNSVNAMLNAEQQTKWADHKKKMQERKKDHQD